MKTRNPIEVTSLTGEDLLHTLERFCRENGAPRCYQNWSPETLRDYLLFHADNKTLVWQTERAGERTRVVGTGVAWQTNERTIRHRHGKGLHQFNWKAGDPAGDSVFFADFVCVRPGALALILDHFARAFPHWKHLKWFTYRREKLIELNKRHVQGIVAKWRHKRG